MLLKPKFAILLVAALAVLSGCGGKAEEPQAPGGQAPAANGRQPEAGAPAGGGAAPSAPQSAGDVGK